MILMKRLWLDNPSAVIYGLGARPGALIKIDCFRKKVTFNKKTCTAVQLIAVLQKSKNPSTTKSLKQCPNVIENGKFTRS